MESKNNLPGLMRTHTFVHLAKAMGVRSAGPLPHGFDMLEDEIDKERVAAATFVVNTTWLAPESERNPNSGKPRFAARVFEIMNPGENPNMSPEDRKYWAIAFVANYKINEGEVPRISSALQSYEFDFHVTVDMCSHILIRAHKNSTYGFGLVVRVEKHRWQEKENERRRLELIEENRRREEELLQSAFSDPTSVVCIPASSSSSSTTSSTQYSQHPPSRLSSLQRFSVSTGSDDSYIKHPTRLETNNFKASAQPRVYHTNIAKRYKAGILGRVADFLLGSNPDNV